MSRVAHISITETDAMSMVENRDFIEVLIEDLEKEKEEIEKAKNKI